MVFEALLSIIFGIVNIILTPLDALNFVFNSSFFHTVVEYLSVIFYILPIGNLSPIIIFIVSMFAFRAVVSLIKTIWDILPFL